MREEDRFDSRLLGSGFMTLNSHGKSKIFQSKESDLQQSPSSLGGVFKQSSTKAGKDFRAIDKTSFKVPDIVPKSELDRVAGTIKGRYKISLEPLDTKMLLEGKVRDTDYTKWITKRDFKSLVRGNSHRKSENKSVLNGKDEPYVSHQKVEFRARDRSKELASQDFRAGGLSLKSALQSQPSIRKLLADNAYSKVNENAYGGSVSKSLTMMDTYEGGDNMKTGK